MEAFDDSACDLLIRQLNSESDPDKLKLMCSRVLLLAQDPKHAEMLLAKGGLKALARVLKQFQNNENVFYPASDAFMALCGTYRTAPHRTAPVRYRARSCVIGVWHN